MGNYSSNVPLTNKVAPDSEAGRPQSAHSTLAEGGGEAVEDLAEKSMKFAAQVPPDWDAAEKHGRASGAYRMVATKLDLSDENSFCLCCQQPLPSEEQKFGCCTSNIEFGDLGATGFPLFFEFNR